MQSDTQNSSKKTEKEVSTQKPETEEIGGPKGLEPTRYGDWEQAGRCTDF